MKVKSDHRSKFSNLSNWKEEAWKNQGFNGIRTRDLRDTGGDLLRWSLFTFIYNRSTIWIISYKLLINELTVNSNFSIGTWKDHLLSAFEIFMN